MHDTPTFPSPLARWSRTIAVFCVQLAVASAVLHRLASLPTPVALNIFLVSLAGALIAVLLALWSLVGIWRDGSAGALSAFTGLALALGLMAWPLGLIPFYRSLPAIHDVTTDTAAPPPFVALAAKRTDLANPAAYGGQTVARRQLAAYPDIRPVIVPRPVGETWEIVGDTVKRLRWRVARETAPTKGKPGYIEAVDRTRILGFYDDVVIRVDGSDRETRIDARSASRYGQHDFGQNATRIRHLFKELKVRLDETVTGAERPRRRGPREDEAVPKRGKGSPVAQRSQSQRQGRARQGSRREPQRTSTQPARGGDRDRDRSSRRSD